MKRIIIFLLFALPVISINAKQTDNEVTLTKQVLLDKIKGGWAGKTIGCTYGGPTEFKYCNTMIRDYVPIYFPKGRIKWYYDNAPGLYDDVYMDLTFVDVFERLGLEAPVDSFAMAFANAPYPLWHANQAARNNILIQKLMPPQSGYWKNNPHADDIDFQIEADYAGIMAPGMINTAVNYTDGIGHMMNYGDGWYGGVYVASMLSLAYVYNDVEKIVTEALKTIPEQSKYYKCIKCVIDTYKQNPNDWKQAWFNVFKEFGESYGCPSGVFSNYSIDATINSAYIVIGLLYGHGDFGKTMDISTRCGNDSDCNPSSAGGILGVMLGYSNIPSSWSDNIKDVEDRDFVYTNISINKATQMSFNQACKVIKANGGKVKKDDVIIATQEPKTVRFEQSFTGSYPVDYVDCGATSKSILKLGNVNFYGTGIAAKGELSCKDKNYVANVEVYVDDKLATTMQLPADSHSRRQELYYNYSLPKGNHTLRYNWTNPVKGANISPWWAIIYSDAPRENAVK